MKSKMTSFFMGSHAGFAYLLPIQMKKVNNKAHKLQIVH